MNHNLPIKQIAAEITDRVTIVMVTFCFSLAMLPHFTHLPLWVSAIALISLTWRLAQAYGYIGVFPKWLLIPMVLAGGIGVFAQFWTIVGRDPGLALLTVMAAFKFIETRTHRDILILVMLCYFLLATHFLFGQSIMIALYMIAILIIITTTLITINQRDESIPIKNRFQASMRLILLSLPMMAILFVLVPRIPGPLWGLSAEQRGGITGLSDSMTPGSISDLITSNEVAFRVTFEGDIPEQKKLYWRGPVMARFDGQTWGVSKTGIIKRSSLQVYPDSKKYTITMEPHGKQWLFALDIPVLIPPGSIMTKEFQLLSKKPVNDLKRYSISSKLDYQLFPNEEFEYLLLNSEFNQNYNPRTLETGKKWAQQFSSDIEIVNHALKMFREGEYFYTLQPPLLGPNSSDEFLFNTRRGFCEHYASSFTLLMRAAGIPARVVTGYQGGELNKVGNYLIVRQSDAHAWSEVWLADKGWVRIDPTAAVSPFRVENGIDQALRDALPSFKISGRNPLISSLLYNWDSLQHQWNDLILNYDHRKQARFLRQLGLGIRSWGDMVIATVIALVFVTASYWLISWYRERPPAPPEYEKILNQLLKKLKKIGANRHPSEHMAEFLVRINSENKIHDQQLEMIVETYTRIKYARNFQKKTIIHRFRKMVSEWEPLTS